VVRRDSEFMAEAVAEARRSLDIDEFPVGAVVVLADAVVARAHWGRPKGAAAA
jgi:tRNA(Arg) A34 adenosine deaminase TadA